MPINTHKKILFIHIPKCSGSYITKLFNLYNEILYTSGPPHDCKILGRTLQHYPISYITDTINTYNIMNNKKENIDLSKYYIFTIVRNPYTRFISAYNQYPNNCNEKYKDMINNRSLIEFVEFLKNSIENEGRNFLKYGAYHQFQPMTDYIDNKNVNIKINIIKIDDNLYEDNIIRLSNMYDINYNGEKINTSSVDNPDYNYYLNNKTFINCINYIYKDDFLMFDYDMLNGNTDVQLLK